MTSIGHRTGLFDVMAGLPPATSEEIAEQAGLNERYVREWLGAMVTGRFVDYDTATSAYHLPAEHAAFLTRQAGTDNVGVFAQYIGLLGIVEDDIVECFSRGGGVPYECYPRFHEVMAEDSNLSVVSALEAHVLPLVPGLASQLEAGIRVLDVGCGSGRIMIRLAELFPNSRFTGLDLSEQAIGVARTEAADKGIENIEFVARDLSDFNATAEPASFDFITTFDAVHDQAQPLNVLKGINHALNEDGVYLMQDIKGSSHVHKNMDHGFAPFIYTISCMHCMTEKAHEYLRLAGFSSVETNELEHDETNNWYVARK
jgi:2-polyprenyl-3-methyl-5-hydroxy-6-metoxy-1,4-benzoquinol methylase